MQALSTILHNDRDIITAHEHALRPDVVPAINPVRLLDVRPVEDQDPRPGAPGS